MHTKSKWKLLVNSSKKPIYPYYCINCGIYLKSFNPLSPFYTETARKYGFPYNMADAETLNMDNYCCPKCNINDRDRLVALFLTRYIRPDKPYSIVEFAPAPPLSAFIKKFKNVTHRTADLFMKSVDDRVDLQDMDIYPDHHFDLFICSHILEHVNDDRKAISELYRILKPGGCGIVMVPLFLSVKETTEDPSVTEEALRWKHFGQYDHVRLYAKDDFIKRLSDAGFRVSMLDVNYFGKDVFHKNGITKKSILYKVTK